MASQHNWQHSQDDDETHYLSGFVDGIEAAKFAYEHGLSNVQMPVATIADTKYQHEEWSVLKAWYQKFECRSCDEYQLPLFDLEAVTLDAIAHEITRRLAGVASQ